MQVFRRQSWLLGLLFASCPAWSDAPQNSNDAILTAARRQIGVTVHYDPAYVRLKFPGGDVPADRGVCTDVIVRALRQARRMDLQQEINADLRANWNQYPHRPNWRLTRPDPNIDHRRVPNLMTFLARRGWQLPVSRKASDFLAGDIVAWDLGGGILHVGVVSDRLTSAATPLVVHNIGAGVREEDILFRYRVIGHFRPSN